MVVITWNGPLDTGGAVISNYTILRGLSEGSITDLVTVSGSTFEYIDTSLEPGTTYYYAIYGTNSVGEGEMSEVLITIPDDIGTTDTSTTTEGTTQDTDTPTIGFGSIFYISLVLVSIVIARKKKLKFN